MLSRKPFRGYHYYKFLIKFLVANGLLYMGPSSDADDMAAKVMVAPDE